MASVTGDQPPSAGRTPAGALDHACRDIDDWPDWNAGRQPPSEEEAHGLVSGPDTSPPDGWASMTEAQRRDLHGGDGPDDHDGGPAAEALEAGFTHHLPSPGATGFAAGGPLDSCWAGTSWPGTPGPRGSAALTRCPTPSCAGRSVPRSGWRPGHRG